MILNSRKKGIVQGVLKEDTLVSQQRRPDECEKGKKAADAAVVAREELSW